MMKRIGLALFICVLCAGEVALAQAGGSLSGTIEGIVKVGDNPVPGVLVTISSPALQGKRSIATGANGDYIFRQLPPGSAKSGNAYTVTFALSGMKIVQQTIDVSLGGSTRQDATLEVTTSAAAVTVSAAKIAAEEEKVAVHGATFKGEDVQNLPVGRLLAQIAANSPGLTERTPNLGQLSISGAFAYDNKFLINGVDISDNVFGSATDSLVIEEAVQETQVMTSNISAEFGGFSGGIVNAITKSGGNVYSGSARADFANPNWRADTPIEAQNQTSRPTTLSEVYSATLGGKIIEDRLWFFGAGRYIDATTNNTLAVTNEAYSTSQKEPRLEGKLTGNINASHTLQFDYTYSKDTRTLSPLLGIIAETSAIQSPTFPSNVLVGSYNGVFTPNFIGGLSYSEKKFQFANSGGIGSNIVSNSPFLSGASGTQGVFSYNAPYFDSTDPEDRNNKDLAGSLSYYLSAGKLGNHDLKVGFDVFHTVRSGGNSQSPTNLVLYADYKQDASGKPVFGPSALGPSQLVPTFVPGQNLALIYLATRGAQTDIRTEAFYFNDSFRLDRFAFSLGVRYEKANGTGPDGATITDTHAFVPRLGAIWDVKGDGRYQVSGSYAQYAGKYNDAQAGQGTRVGNPNGIYAIYTGPAGEGYGFAPGFDFANYTPVSVNFPTANVTYPSGVSAPITTEVTLSVGGKITPTFNAAATFIYRNTTNFIEDFINNPTAAGRTDIIGPADSPYPGVDLGTFDNKVFANSDVPRRRYEALAFQTGYNGIRNVFLQANYTYMLKFEGTFEGEGTNTPGISSPLGNYPEIQALDRNIPFGNLSGFEKHKLRLLGTYNIHSPIGVFTPGLIYAYDSGAPYNITSTVPYTAIQKARNPGYASLPPTQTIFYGDRGNNFFPSQQRWDLALAWDAPLHKTVAPYVRFAITNLFDTHYLVAFDSSVTPNDGRTVAGVTHPTGPLDANGLPTTFTKGPAFGTATSSINYQPARTLSVAAGIRF
jgi:Carboxypeptidase regulatory-like domain